MAGPTPTDLRTQPGAGWRRNNRLWWLAALLLLLVVFVNTGCDPGSTLGYLLAPWYPNTDDAPCSLVLPDKESKVVFICAHEDPNLADPVFRDADQTICRDMVKLLNQRYKENKDKVKIVPVSQVYAYTKEHRNWMTMSKQEFGKHFDADFVVFIELGPMTMKEPLSRGTLYSGNVDYQIAVVEVHQTEGESLKYDTRGTTATDAKAVTDVSAVSFRASFLDRVAKDLAKYFASYPAQDKMSND